jgi:chorismate mutase/prephenate dehydratase
MRLEDLRKKIDEIDDKLVDLLNERTNIVIEIGKLKQKMGVISYHPDRENMIYRRLKARSKGPFPPEALRAVYREIMSASLNMETPLRVAYLGPEATFTHLAAKKRFGTSTTFVPVKKISDVFLEVEKGRSDYGVVPIENTTEGAVTHTLDMFVMSDLKICSEVLLPISHSLLSKHELNRVKKVYSHPQAFAQTKVWLEENLKDVTYIEVSSTAEAARLAAQEEGAAAIGSELAGEIYDLNVVIRGIEDQEENITRFLVIGWEIPQRTGHDRTSILFSIKDRPGALYDMLAPFAKGKINLTKIESRPSRKKAFDYFFFLDMEGHIKDRKVKTALRQLEENCVFLKILGSYPVDSENSR